MNYAGNSFCEKSWDMITEHNPMALKDEDGRKQDAMQGIAKMFSSANVKIGRLAPAGR